MTEYQRLKAEYDGLKEKQMRAEARRDVCVERLKAAGFETTAAAEQRILKLKRSIARDEAKRDALLEKVRAALNG